MISKTKLIKHLENDIYCRVGVSELHGVGVIAIKDIGKGINPFKNLSHEKEKIITLTDNDLKNVDDSVKKVMTDFFGTGNSNTYDVLCYGPNYLNISYYLNHSTKPNLDLVEGKSEYYEFVTNKEIKKGEELLINYKLYDDIKK